MDKGTAMNAELYEALRNMGIGEKEALQVAKAVPPSDAAVKQLRADLDKSQADIEKMKDEAKAANLENARSDERSKGDRKLFFAVLGLLVAVAVMMFQLFLPD